MIVDYHPQKFNKDDYLSATQIADILNITKEAVYWWIKKGDLKAFKHRGRYYTGYITLQNWIGRKEYAAEKEYKRYKFAGKVLSAVSVGASVGEAIALYLKKEAE